MLRFKKTWLLRSTLLSALLLGGPAAADAAFTLRLHQNGYTDAVVTDNVSGDGSSAVGVISFSGSFGDFQIQVTIGSSNSQAEKTPAQLSIISMSITSWDGVVVPSAPLVLTLQDDGFKVPAPGPVLMTSQLSTTQAPQGTNVSFQSFLDSSGGTTLSLNGVGGTSVVDPVNIGTTPYTLTNVTTITMTNGGTVNTTGITYVATPAPSSAMLALASLPALGCFSWLRRRKMPVAV